MKKLVVSCWLLAACVAMATGAAWGGIDPQGPVGPVEGYYDVDETLVTRFPVDDVRAINRNPTAEEIAAADAAIDAAGGLGPKLEMPLAVMNGDGSCTLITGNLVADRLLRRLGNVPPGTTFPVRTVGENRETMLVNSAYDPNVPERTWKSDDFGDMAVVTNFRHYVTTEANWQQNMTNQMTKLYALAEEATNDFVRAFMSVTNLLGRSDGYCRTSLKGKERAYEKTVENMAETAGWPNVNTVYDVFGCTFVLGDWDDFAKVLSLVEAEFAAFGFRAVRVKNCYYTGSVKTSGYADVKINIRYSNGFTGEVILIEENMNREKTEGVSHEVYEIRRDYDASTSGAKDMTAQRIMDDLDRLMRIIQFNLNPEKDDSHDQFQGTYNSLVDHLPCLKDQKYAEIWSAKTRANLDAYIERITDPAMYDGYRARCAELAARPPELRVGVPVGMVVDQLPTGSDQCQSAPVSLLDGTPVRLVEPIEVQDYGRFPDPKLGEFVYAVFGDTQNYMGEGTVCSNASFKSRIDWLLDNKDMLRFSLVTHLGDVVDHADDPVQWALAHEQLARLYENGIPFGIAPGNHDLAWGDASRYVQYVPWEWFRGDADAFGGFAGLRYVDLYPEVPAGGTRAVRYIGNICTDWEARDATPVADVGGAGANSVRAVTVPGSGPYGNLVFIHLQCSTPKPVLDWVDKVLDDAEEKGRYAIIVSHEGLGVQNYGLPFEDWTKDRVNIGRMRMTSFTSNESRSAQYQWERVYSRHRNVLMVLSGHQQEAISEVRTSRNAFGDDVVEISQNYPELPYSNWIRLYYINAEEGTVRAYTWSPHYQRLCKGDEREFTPEANEKHVNFLFATNCLHNFKFNFNALRRGSDSPLRRGFLTVTDGAATDGTYVNGRELRGNGFAVAGIAAHPIVRKVELGKDGGEAVIRYNLLNDHTVTDKAGSFRILGVVRPRVLFSQGYASAEVTDVLTGDVVAGGGGWHEVRVPLATVAERLGVAADELTDVVATVATVPEGTRSAPWAVGKDGADVTAYLEEGMLFVEGTGAMVDFASAADAPWAPAASRISRVEVAPTVKSIGEHAFDGIPANVPLALTEAQVPRAAGSIGGAEFDKVAIMDGKAYLDVSVYTSDTVTNQNWSVATNGVIEVPASGKQGFFYLMSKPSAQSNAIHAPIFIPENVEE